MQFHKVKEPTVLDRVLTFAVGVLGVLLGAAILLMSGPGF
jgi:hypothetical protein